VIKTTNALRGWSHHPQQRRTATILEKSKNNRHISATVRPISTKFGMATQFNHLKPSTVENLKIQQQAKQLAKSRIAEDKGSQFAEAVVLAVGEHALCKKMLIRQEVVISTKSTVLKRDVKLQLTN